MKSCFQVVPVLVLLVPSAGRGPLLPFLLVLICWLSSSVAPTVHPASSCSQRWVWVLGHPSLALFHHHTFVVPFAGLTVSTLQAGAHSGGVGRLLRLPIIFRHFVVVLPSFCRCFVVIPVSCTRSHPASRCSRRWGWVLGGLHCPVVVVVVVVVSSSNYCLKQVC